MNAENTNTSERDYTLNGSIARTGQTGIIIKNGRKMCVR